MYMSKKSKRPSGYRVKIKLKDCNGNKLIAKETAISTLGDGFEKLSEKKEASKRINTINPERRIFPTRSGYEVILPSKKR